MAGAIAGALRRGQGGWGFLGGCMVLFAAGVAATVGGCASMAAMGGVPMPGGWTLSMAWMRMPGQDGLRFALSFLGMWTAMTVAMMLPSLIPVLWRYRRAIGPAPSLRLDWLSACVGAGYFLVWVALGAAVLPPGLALAQAGLRSPAWARAVPTVAGAIAWLAGVLQLTAWKARRLACCRTLPVAGQRLPAAAAAAWRLGTRLGWHCIACCAPLMGILLVVGVMDLRAMAVTTLAITAERLAPAGERVARGVGLVLTVAGMLQFARATGLA